ncbi:helix-turn-helix domain-containing protein [uncultured Corynebacterium sp.]|uniref:Helix-turn-helix domain-containing protein n=2 Tax=Corynebacteriaceae TaxID=1653 RepID=A0ABX8L0X1_9CORY|nr:helix-turn-helix domain-containing protein [Corynebacterium coyleae]
MTHGEMSIGERIIAARHAVGMTQRDLAEVSGLSQPTIQRVETGAREPSPLQLSALAFGCGVSPEALRDSDSARVSALVAGRTDDAGSEELADYLLFALEMACELDKLGVPDQP